MSASSVGTTLPATTSFAELGLPDKLLSVLHRRGLHTPLPIQSATIADALAGRDVSGKAPTGSGKTLAFALPLASTVGRGSARRPRGLVLAPTRELAAQIAGELAPLLAAQGRTAHAVYGGVGFGPQRTALRRGVDVLVACPGRLEDLMRMKDVILTDVGIVVIDEADRMADMGFLPAVRRILDSASDSRQTLLFSATLDGDVDVLVRRYQKDPVRHEVAPEADEMARVTHAFHDIAREDRTARCAQLVDDAGSTIVFVRTKHGADRVATQLARAGVKAQAIHGGRSQSQREQALKAFRSGSVRALVATDVAARGIHVDDVSQVIHYDMPEDPKDYIHRSGRTARAGSGGSVVTFVMPDQKRVASQLRRDLKLEVTAVADTSKPGRTAGGQRPGKPVGRGRRPDAPGARTHSQGTSTRTPDGRRRRGNAASGTAKRSDQRRFTA